MRTRLFPFLRRQFDLLTRPKDVHLVAAARTMLGDHRCSVGQPSESLRVPVTVREHPCGSPPSMFGSSAVTTPSGRGGSYRTGCPGRRSVPAPRFRDRRRWLSQIVRGTGLDPPAVVIRVGGDASDDGPAGSIVLSIERNR